MALAAFSEVLPLIAQARLVNASGTGPVTLATAGPTGARVDDILVTSTDTSPRVLQLILLYNSVPYLLGSVSIPAGQGSAGTPPIQLGATLGPTNQSGWLVPFGASLQVQVESAVTAAKEIDIVAQGGSF